MADKKPNPELDPDNPIVKKVDQMMDIKGGPVDLPVNDEDSAVSDVAASVNKSLSQNLGNDPIAETEEPSVQAEPVPATESSQTAPELPKEQAEEIEEPQASEEATEEAAEPDPESSDEPIQIPESDIDDSYTQKAVDDIVSEESDKILAVEDAKNEIASSVVVSKVGFKEKIRRLFSHRRFWIITFLIFLVIFAIPATRYKILGLVIKKSVTITVVDSKTSSPVSNANVDLAGQSTRTDANGKATISAGLGKRDLTVTKKYYQTLDSAYFVGIKTTSSQVKLVATGRLVPVTVVNKITGKPISGAQIQSEGTNAKTNAKGIAEIALPTKAATYAGKIAIKGYNPTDVTIVVTDKIVKANSFEITPSGQVYFLSNRNGSLDVVKSNLDGTNRKIVLAGTGKEDSKTTSLLASRDWKYLALKSHREGAQASLYLIDTSTDKVTQFDNGDADFTLVGWHDHNFVYALSRNNLNYSQTGKQALKSYNADNLQLNQLDQTTAEGSAGSSAYQNFGSFYITDDLVVYTTQWNKEGAAPSSATLAGKNDTIRGIQPNGQNKKDYQSFPSADNNYIQASPYEPQGIYFAVYNNNSKPTFYAFENQAVKTSNIDQATFDKTYPTFLLSPSGSQTFWTELRDGKNALFIGDANAGNKKQVATLSDYSPYGWFSDNYTLVSKNSSELYITSPGSLSANRAPLKITDYYKSAQSYAGYGYGYGGL